MRPETIHKVFATCQEAEEIVCKTSMKQKILNIYLRAVKDFSIFGLKYCGT